MKIVKFLDKTSTYLIGILFGLIILYLTFLNMFSTCAMDTDEHTYFLTDDPLFHLLVLIIFIGSILFYRRSKFSVSNPKTILKWLFRIVIVCNVIWIFSTQLYPRADQNAVLLVAKQLREHDYSAFLPGGYAYIYPHH